MTLIELLCQKSPGFRVCMIGRCAPGLLGTRAYSGRAQAVWLCEWKGGKYDVDRGLIAHSS